MLAKAQKHEKPLQAPAKGYWDMSLRATAAIGSLADPNPPALAVFTHVDTAVACANTLVQVITNQLISCPALLCHCCIRSMSAADTSIL